VILSNSLNYPAGNKKKQFSFKCHGIMSSKLTAAFQSMEVRNSTFACFIELLTPNTYVMVVISDPSICKFIVSD
jgi:Ras-related GTP-binding protein A/B